MKLAAEITNYAINSIYRMNAKGATHYGFYYTLDGDFGGEYLSSSELNKELDSHFDGILNLETREITSLED
mgnify:CR=1 FL=1|jgi:hypothetical protein|tara:strand:- start:172 stop:384 length:213 start_codon:yes stop_codon:yes gene_type:complete